MRSRQNGLQAMVKSALVALACAVALTGCSQLPFDLPRLPELPFELPQLPELPELPFDLPQLPELPFDLPQLPNPFASLGTQESVDEARAAKAAEKQSLLTADDLVTADYLTVGLQTGSVSAPFVVTSESGGLYGIDVDFASAVADQLGLRVRFVTVTEVDPPLAAGECDVVLDASLLHTKTASIVGNYYETASAFFAQGEPRVITVADLDGKTVAVQDGSVSQGVLGRTTLAVTQQPYGNLNEAFDALSAGEVDYVLCDAYPGAYLAAAYEGISFVGALSTPSPVGVAVVANNEGLQQLVQQAVETVLTNGTMDLIRDTWIGGMDAVTVEDVIADVPLADGATLDDWGEPQDGSSAGANAVTVL